jgi:hypothetical protein
MGGEVMPYGSASDLPMIQALLLQLKSMTALRWLLSKDQRSQVSEVKAQVEQLVRTVDGFYGLLGPMHWVFHDDMSSTDMAELVQKHAGHPERAEEALVAWYQVDGRLGSFIRRLSWHEAWRARMPLLQRAQVDYMEQRYYAVVQVLLSVMDGFVNDLNPADRKGLHAREAGELDAWNSVVGHHEGLTSAHGTFRKTFKARSDAEVVELYRNGIVHGMLTNYDNVVVATKAWNRLFAVSDWARSMDARAHQEHEQDVPTLQETVKRYAEVQETRRVVDQFEPRTVGPGDSGFESSEVRVASEAFLDAWLNRRYGLVLPMLAHLAGTVTARMARDELGACPLSRYEVLAIEEDAIAVHLAQVELETGDGVIRTNLRWIFEDSDGNIAVPARQPGQWRLVWWTPSALLVERGSVQ